MRSQGRGPSRLAVGFVVVGLALSAIGIAYIIYAGRPRELPPLSATQPDPRVQQLDALTRMLTDAFLLILAFLVGSYLMVRLGRRVLERRPHHEPSKYVDAWGTCRVTQSQIDAATRQLYEEFPAEPPPDGPQPEPPDDET